MGIIRLLTLPLVHKAQLFYGRIFQGNFSGGCIFLLLFLGSLDFLVWVTFFRRRLFGLGFFVCSGFVSWVVIFFSQTGNY